MKCLPKTMLFFPLAMLSFKDPVKKMNVLFFGDSITEAGMQPDGFIVKIDSIIKQSRLKDSIELTGAGVSGNKVYDLYLRMEDDVMKKHPDLVVIYIGINDIWHKESFGTGTDADKFEKFYRAIIKKLLDKNIRVVVCTPTVIGERNDQSNHQDGDLNQYSKIIRGIAKDFSIPVCDLRKAFGDYLIANNPGNVERGILTSDGVHLNARGNLLVSTEMWKVIQKMVK